MNYIYTRILEGDIKNRYIGKKVKVIKQESHFSYNFLNITGYVIDYDYDKGMFKIKISLPWGSESLIVYSEKKIYSDKDNKTKWEKIYEMAKKAKIILDGDIKKKSEQVFIELMLEYGKDTDNRVLQESLEMFSKYNFIITVKNRSSLNL